MEHDFLWKTTFDGTRPLIEALPKTTCTLPKPTRRWTYSALCYCGDGNIESEYHVMFICRKYHHLRQAWLSKISCPDQFSLLTPCNKFKVTLNDPDNVRITAKYLVAVMDLRRLQDKDY